MAFSSDGQMLATTSAGPDSAPAASEASLRAEPRVLRGHTAAVVGVAFSPDGQMLATTSADRTVRLWSLSQPEGGATRAAGPYGRGGGRGVQSRWADAGDDELGPDRAPVAP